ncbi:MAG: hypothetical protein DRO11_05315 [Methanobacteriota archaeon]|nr:MAG: hypothetical protein DRO11_05315 [Euryarchaeota archaeon]
MAKKMFFSPLLVLSILVLVITIIFVVLAPQMEIPSRGFKGVLYEKLGNGAQVLIKEDHSVPIVTVDIWVATGSANEDDKNNGVSHFLEHMLFKGTEKRGVGQISLEIDSIGGYNNAATSKDYTHYYVVAPSQHLELVVDIQADVIFNSSFDPVEIEKERGVILEELSRRNDNPRSYTWDLLPTLAYKQHPYKRTILGSEETIKNLGREDFLAYYRTWYVPNNLWVVIVGDVDAEETLSLVKQKFGFAKNRPLPEVRREREPPQTEIRRHVEHRDLEQAYMRIGWHVAGRLEAPEEDYVLDVIMAILGEGRSSRLYRILREEERLVSLVDVSYGTSRDPALLTIYAELPPENVEKAEKAIVREVTRLAKEPVDSSELAKVKNMLRSDHYYSIETCRGLASRMGFYSVVAGDYRVALNYPEEIEKVTAEDVMRVAKKYFGENNYTIVVLLPEKVETAAS